MYFGEGKEARGPRGKLRHRMIHISLEELTRHMGVRVSCVCGAEIPATASPCPGAQTPEGLGREGELSALVLECVRGWGRGAVEQVPKPKVP